MERKTAVNRLDGVRALLTVGALEFFGPALRDIGPSHATNPTWVGHARLHMVWTIILLVALGVLDLVLVFRGRGTEREAEHLRLAGALQLANLVAFWTAWAMAPIYGGAVVIEQHAQVFGINENTLVFIVLSVVFAITVSLFAVRTRANAAVTV
jgi:hypothetical protein